MLYRKNTMGIQEKAELEAAQLGVGKLNISSEKMAANIDYIAMMADVELPEEEDEEAEFDGEE